MTTREPSKADNGAGDPDSRLGAFRDEMPPTPGDGHQPTRQAPSTHVEPRDAEPIPARKDNTGIAPS